MHKSFGTWDYFVSSVRNPPVFRSVATLYFWAKYGSTASKWSQLLLLPDEKKDTHPDSSLTSSVALWAQTVLLLHSHHKGLNRLARRHSDSKQSGHFWVKNAKNSSERHPPPPPAPKYMSVFLSVSASVCLSVCLRLSLSVSVSLCLYVCVSVSLSLSACPYACLSDCLSVSLSVGRLLIIVELSTGWLLPLTATTKWRHGRHSSGFLSRILFETFWLAQAARVIGSQKPFICLSDISDLLWAGWPSGEALGW